MEGFKTTLSFYRKLCKVVQKYNFFGISNFKTSEYKKSNVNVFSGNKIF
jgi:hypothetical protein